MDQIGIDPYAVILLLGIMLKLYVNDIYFSKTFLGMSHLWMNSIFQNLMFWPCDCCKQCACLHISKTTDATWLLSSRPPVARRLPPTQTRLTLFMGRRIFYHRRWAANLISYGSLARDTVLAWPRHISRPRLSDYLLKVRKLKKFWFLSFSKKTTKFT